jgi:Delta7-sterol 5-desaturase
VIAGLGDIRREVLYSLLSLAIFASLAVVTLSMYLLGWNRLYLNVHAYGWTYLWLSTAALIFLHDAWFYWTHRAMHTKLLFRHVHRVHHMSHNPTPWAAFAFHPLEAVVEGAIFPLLVIVMPLHPLAAAIWLMYMTLMNVFGHLGYEVLPPGFVRHKLFRWHNTSVHHNMHHSRFHCNYGLYFNIWDRLMGTNHHEYEQEYDRVTGVATSEAHGAGGRWGRFSASVVLIVIAGFISYAALSARWTAELSAAQDRAVEPQPSHDAAHR